jgi:hypothetical protein
MNRLTPYKLLLVALTCLMMQGCGGDTTSGTLLHNFDLGGRWTGTMSNRDGTRLISVSMTLSDVAGAISGIIVAPDYECVTSGKLTGTATAYSDNSVGDDPLTFDSITKSQGVLSLDWQPQPIENSPDRLSHIKIALAGSSSHLSGNYSGYWVLGDDDDGLCGSVSMTPSRQTEGVMTLSRS